jgi:hypothetical protein
MILCRFPPAVFPTHREGGGREGKANGIAGGKSCDKICSQNVKRWAKRDYVGCVFHKTTGTVMLASTGEK